MAKLFDIEEALRRIDDDLELYFELITIFFEEYDNSINDIRKSIEQADGTALERSAHSIKGALGNIGAMTSFEMAYSLETKGREGTIDGAEKVFKNLINEISLFKAQVEEYKNSNS